MNKFFNYLLVSFLMLSVVLSSCEKEPEKEDVVEVLPFAEFKLKQVVDSTVLISAETKLAKQYAYIITEDIDMETPSAEDLFNKGVIAGVQTENFDIEIVDLTYETTYKLFISVEYLQDDQSTEEIENPKDLVYSEVMQVDEIVIGKDPNEKPDPPTKELVEILTPNNVGELKYNLNVPEGKTIAVRVLSNKEYERWKNLGLTDASILEGNVGVSGRTVHTESTEITFTEWKDENVDIDVAPREILVVVAAEAEVETLDGIGDIVRVPYFDLGAYNSALNSDPENTNEDDFWTTEYHKTITTIAGVPNKLSSKNECVLKNTTTQSATFSITPSDGIHSFSYLTLSENEWNILEDRYGYDGAVYWTTLYGSEDDKPVEVVVDFLKKDIKYKFILVSKGDEFGTSQNEVFIDFEVSTATKPAPEFVVTPIISPVGEPSPWEVWYNIKCETKDIVEFAYICNDVSEWESAINQGATYLDICTNFGEFITEPAYLGAINSDEGLNIMFRSWEDTKSRLVVVGYNDELTISNPDADGSTSIADNITIPQPYAPRVESSLFEELQGEWTVVAYLFEDKNELEGKPFTPAKEPTYASVNITSTVDYPSSTPSSLAQKFTHLNSSEIDDLYEDFKSNAEKFADKTRGQNRLLCKGLDLNRRDNGISTEYFSPLALLEHPSYSPYYSTQDNFFDFGLKWNLQIHEDGRITLPIDQQTIAPTNNNFGNQLLNFALEIEYGTYSYGVKEFEVELSEDGDTLTVKPVSYDGKKYYYCVGYTWGPMQNVMSPVIFIADFKLVRGSIDEVSKGQASYYPTSKYPSLNLPEKNYQEGKKTNFSKIIKPINYKKVHTELYRTDNPNL